jgi:hypothetical protein
MAQNSPDRVFNSNGYTLIFGDFLYQMSKYSGGGIPVDPMTAAEDLTWPKINGSITAVIPDGTGGWYVGGNFDYIDTVRLSNLAHINDDKTVDREWKPNPNNSINDLELNGNTLYVAGYFTKMFAQTRNYAAAFDISSGNLLAWNPNPSSNVRSLEFSNNLVYAGGYFTTIGGQPRTYVAALDPVTGLATSWAPQVENGVFALAVDAATNSIFIGGYFDAAGGQTRTRLARLATNTTAGLATPWTADLNTGGYIEDLELHNNILYVGGHFNTIGGITRYGIAALDPTKNTANVLTWNAGLENGDWVNDIEIQNTSLYMAGYFDSVNGTLRPTAASLNLTTGVLNSAWAPYANNDVNVIASTPTSIFLGGAFSGVNSTEVTGVAVIDEATNTIWPHTIDLNGGQVYAMTISGNTLFIGGQFSTVNGQSRKNLAAFNLSNGQLLPWAPSASGTTATFDNTAVMAMEMKDNILYIGGTFLEITVSGVSTSRANLAALNTTTGAPTTWDPIVGNGTSTSQYILSLDIDGNTVYVGGLFTQVDGQARTNMAAIDVSSGAVQSWAPDLPGGYVSKIAVAGNTVYVFGDFPKTIGGEFRPYNIAALDRTTGLATSWDPTFLGEVYDFTLTPSEIFVAGDFVIVNNEPRQYIASFGLADSALTPWNSDINAYGEAVPQIVSVSASPNRLRVTGWFEYLGEELRNNYAEYDFCAAVSTLSLNGTTLTAATGDSYQWFVNDEAIEDATAQTLEISAWEYGVYAVEVTTDGCTSRSGDYTYLVTENGNEHGSGIEVYPNPVEHSFNIKVTEQSTLEILTVVGKPIIKRILAPGTPNIIDFDSAPTGTYLVRVSSGTETQTVKIVKTH